MKPTFNGLRLKGEVEVDEAYEAVGRKGLKGVVKPRLGVGVMEGLGVGPRRISSHSSLLRRGTPRRSCSKSLRT